MDLDLGGESPDAASRFRATRLERALDWAASRVPSPFIRATDCCGMALARGGDPFEALGTGPPAIAARAADLLIVAGSITRREVPLIRSVYERMLAPRWVIAWGACAISGGAYDNYATVAGLDRILPVDIVVPGCPPPAGALRDALERLRSEDGVRKHRATRPAHPSSERGDWPILREDPGEPGASDAPVPEHAAREAEGSGHVDLG